MNSTMGPGESLGINETRTSTNGQFELILQPDGNLVLHRLPDHFVFWNSVTPNRGVRFATMQWDGNLVLSDSNSSPVGRSGTFGNDGAILEVQGDGKVAIHVSGGPNLWENGPIFIINH